MDNPTLSTVAELMCWYVKHQQAQRHLSAARKACIELICRVHIRPALYHVPLEDLDRQTIVKRLITPLQASVSVGYVRKVWMVLGGALRRAEASGLIEFHPASIIRFSHFHLTPPKPKAARLRPFSAVPLATKLLGEAHLDPLGCTFVLMMLMHGTRAGETRQAKWADIHFDEAVWVIPADTTKTKVELVMPLTDAALHLLSTYREEVMTDPRHKLSPYLFPGFMHKELSAGGANWAVTRQSDGEWSGHDVRKLARACWAELGVDYMTAELLLNHSLGVLAATYVQVDLMALRRAALVRWHEHLGLAGASYLSNIFHDPATGRPVPFEIEPKKARTVSLSGTVITSSPVNSGV